MDKLTGLYLAQEIPKGENLMKHVKEYSPQWKVVAPALTKMYLLLNQEVGSKAQEMKYGLDQSKWPDSKPLETLSRQVPGIELTQWYQLQLSAMLDKTEHPWVKLITA